MGGKQENDNIKNKYRQLDKKEKQIVSILKNKTHKQHNGNNNKGNKNKNTKRRLQFKSIPLPNNKRNGTRKKNRKQDPSAKQLKIRNRTLTPMPMSSSL